MEKNYFTSDYIRSLKRNLFGLALTGIVSCAAYAQTYSFTPCGATGSLGPSQGMATGYYSTTNLAGLVAIIGQGIQQFTIPTSGAYSIRAIGAAGGSPSQNCINLGGFGANMYGEFNFTAGQVIQVLVGQAGVPSTNNQDGGGGGGSFVVSAGVPLIVGGGGGGATNNIGGCTGTQRNGIDASLTTAGTNGANGTGAGGTNGSGGIGSGGGAGGGFLTNGTGGGPTSFGLAYVNGGAGGNYNTAGPGGFGGGGSGYWEGGNGGGGGGYSGGGTNSSSPYSGGGGGGSFNSGINQVNALNSTRGDGMVILTKLCNVNITAAKNPICKGESVDLSTNAVGGITWAHNGSSSPTVNVSPAATTNYTVTGQAVNGCTTSIAITVTVNPVPVISAAVSPSVLCIGKTATLVASGANTYTWTTGPVAAQVTTVNPVLTTSYTYTGTNQYGCTTSSVVAVTVNTNTLGITPNTSICEGQSIVLTANNAVTYTWSTGNNFASTPVSPITNTSYAVSGTDIHNCVLSNVVNITVDSRPNVSASASKNTICKGESVNLTAGGASTYTWSGAAGTGAQVTINPPVDVVYNYTVVGTSANGCTNTAVVAVTVSRCSGISTIATNLSATRIYPNPAGNEVSIEHNTGLHHAIEVTDMTGRIVMSVVTEEQNIRLGLDKLSAGVYYFKVRSADSIEVIKVIRE